MKYTLSPIALSPNFNFFCISISSHLSEGYRNASWFYVTLPQTRFSCNMLHTGIIKLERFCIISYHFFLNLFLFQIVISIN